MKQNTIFHVHSYRCRHASEESDEEYVKKAIELGAKQIAFTDHAPFPDNPFHYRMLMAEFPEYLSTLQMLREKYADEIDVKIGLEIEFIPHFTEYYKTLLSDYELDFLLLGQHFFKMNDGRYSFEMQDKSEEYKVLATGMIAGIESGLFPVVAHPDQIFRRCKTWNEEMEIITQKIKTCALKNGIILEQNISNMFEKKRKHLYWDEFWQNTEPELKVMYGVDAHSVSEMEENYKRQQLLQVDRKG